MPRAVLFDVDGVLVHGYHTRAELQRRWDEHMLEDLGVDPAAFKQRFIFDVFVKKVIIGQLGLVEALDAVLPQLGYKGPTQRFVAYWLERDSQLNTELIGIAGQLKSAGARIFVATNQEHLRAQWLWQTLRLGETFDDMFYAARLGVTKPNPRFYAEVERRIGPQPEPPLFFDDSPEVVAAARKAGWEAVVYESLADCTTHPWVAARLNAPIVTSR
jgi:putative hydrolase of the HAD superfamily